MSAPLPAHGSADSPYLFRKQRETLLCFKILTIKRSHIAHRKTCPIVPARRHRDIATFRHSGKIKKLPRFAKQLLAFVRMKGLEPPRLTSLDPKSNAATNYATCAEIRHKGTTLNRFLQI